MRVICNWLRKQLRGWAHKACPFFFAIPLPRYLRIFLKSLKKDIGFRRSTVQRWLHGQFLLGIFPEVIESAG